MSHYPEQSIDLKRPSLGRFSAAPAERRRAKIVGALGIAVSTILCILLVPATLINVLMVIDASENPNRLPGAFGYKPVVVQSESMSPALEPDALVFIKEADPAALKSGDVVCYLHNGSAVTHRIEKILTENGETRIVTKGDASDAPDRVAVTPDKIEGVYAGKINGIGGLAMFMQTPTGLMLFIALPFGLYLLWDAVSGYLGIRRERRRESELESELSTLRAAGSANVYHQEKSA